MKIAIIGNKGHLGYILDGLAVEKDVLLAGICPGPDGADISIFADSCQQLGHSPKIFDNYLKMLDEVKPDICGVGCNLHNHGKICLELLKRNIHIFVEKPIATKLDELDELESLFKKKKIHLASMLAMRYFSSFLTAQKYVADGAIGKVRLLSTRKSYKLGIRPEEFKSREITGGTIPWVGSHSIDWIRWFSGENFKSVYASHSILANQNHGELEMSALCHFTLSNDVFASASIDYLRPQNATSHGDDRIRVAGTKGVVEVRDGQVYLINESSDGTKPCSLLETGNFFADFIKQIKGEGTCRLSAEDTFLNTRAALLARQSADENKVIFF